MKTVWKHPAIFQDISIFCLAILGSLICYYHVKDLFIHINILSDEANLVLDFSSGEPTLVKSTVDSPQVLDDSAVFQLAAGDFSILIQLVNRTNLDLAREAFINHLD